MHSFPFVFWSLSKGDLQGKILFENHSRQNVSCFLWSFRSFTFSTLLLIHYWKHISARTIPSTLSQAANEYGLSISLTPCHATWAPGLLLMKVVFVHLQLLCMLSHSGAAAPALYSSLEKGEGGQNVHMCSNFGSAITLPSTVWMGKNF